MEYRSYLLGLEREPATFAQLRECDGKDGFCLMSFEHEPYRVTCNVGTATATLTKEMATIGGPTVDVDRAKTLLEEIIGITLREFP